MKIQVGSVWKNIAEDGVHADERGKYCVVKEINDHPDFNGDRTIELLYTDGTLHTGRGGWFTPGITHEPYNDKEEPNMNQRNPWMHDYRVMVYLKGEVVHTSNVRGKDPGRAVTNVLTNIYRGDLDKVEIEGIEEKMDKLVIKRDDLLVTAGTKHYISPSRGFLGIINGVIEVEGVYTWDELTAHEAFKTLGDPQPLVDDMPELKDQPWVLYKYERPNDDTGDGMFALPEELFEMHVSAV